MCRILERPRSPEKRGGVEEVVATNDDLKITDRRTEEGSFGHADMVAAVFSNAARE